MRKIFAAALVALVLCAAPADAGQKYLLRFGFETPRNDSEYVGAERMAQLAKERSGGRLELRLFPDSVLGNGPAMMSQLRGGTLDLYLGGSGFFANMAEELNILELPFLFYGPAHSDAVLEGAVGRDMLSRLEPFGIQGLAFWEKGYRCVTNNRNPVRTAADLKGMKIRTLANPMHIEAWTLLGTNPVPMPLAELYTALETKTVEAQEHPLNVTYSAKLYEVQKYLTESNHALSVPVVAMNKKKFDSLPEDLQQILLECALEGGRAQKEFNRTNIARMVEEMVAAGCEFVPASEVDMDSFATIIQDKTRGMYLERYGKDIGEKWLQDIDAARK